MVFKIVIYIPCTRSKNVELMNLTKSESKEKSLNSSVF